jgi:hypothetical protein
MAWSWSSKRHSFCSALRGERLNLALSWWRRSRFPRSWAAARRAGGDGVVLELEEALLLLGAEGGAAELGAELVEALEVSTELGGGAAGGGAGIVKLVHEAGGEGAEGGHFFLLHGHALDALEAGGHVAQDGLADLGAGGHEVPERLFVEADDMAGDGGLGADEVGDVGEQRDLSEGGSGVEVELVNGVAVGAGLGHAELAVEQDVEELRGVALVVEHVAFGEMDLLETFETLQLLVFEGRENGDGAKLGENLGGELVGALRAVGGLEGRSRGCCGHC